jgi:tetratricopeptide (TPR) repeat protein
MRILKKMNKQGLYGFKKPYLNSSKSSQAEEAFKQAIELNPENDSIYTDLGQFYLERGEYPRAEEALKKAIELNPRNDRAYIELGRFYRDQYKFHEAEDAFKKAIELNPKNGNTYLELGQFYHTQHKLSQVEDAFKQAVELNPENDNAYLELGWLSRDQGKISLAEESFKKAIELNPKNDYAYFVLGWLYYTQHKLPQAEELFRHALDLNPENDSTIGALSVLYEETGRSQLAGEYSKKVNRLRLGYCLPITIKNYHKLKEMTDKRGIQLVCMQYPMRSVEPLKKMFENDQGRIIFVDNDGVFKKAVKKAGYQEYFVDMFGGDFGHCTDEGNKLLAQNIANTILKKVFGK